MIDRREYNFAVLIRMRQLAPFVAVALLIGLSSPSTGQWLTYPTPGIPRLPNGKPDLGAPAPQTPDGRPDLTGIWAYACSVGSGCFAAGHFQNAGRGLPEAALAMTPWAQGIQRQRQARNAVDDPVGYCLPAGVPRVAFQHPFRILQTSQMTAFLHEGSSVPVYRQIFTDGRPLPDATEPTWLGYSIGRWEKDVFVVNSTGFRDRGWLDGVSGHPHSDALRLEERFRRPSFGRMELTMTINDPKAYVQPFTVTAIFNLLADTDLIEGFCDNHDKTMEHRRIDPSPPEPPSPSLSK